jgi:death on curing protein
VKRDFLYLTTSEVLVMHSLLIRQFGGSDGVRDVGLLEAALFRPQTGYYSDIIEEAAALLESLAVNHPFVDGNKRVAFAVTDVFLRINGYEINSTSQKIYSELIRLFDAREIDFKNLEKFLRKVVIKS